MAHVDKFLEYMGMEEWSYEPTMVYNEGLHKR